jgi:hypothetical protein
MIKSEKTRIDPMGITGLQNKGDRSADLSNVSFAPQLGVTLTVIV